METQKMNLQQLGNVEVLTRSQMKNVLGGKADGCSVSTKCVKTVYNETTHKFEQKETGTASCDAASGSCDVTSTGVKCGSDTANCGSGSYPA